ncbi:MAG: Ig-like domain-containing protein [Amphritea sp.]
MSQHSISQNRPRYANILATLSLSAAVAFASNTAVAQQPEHAHHTDQTAAYGQNIAATNAAAQRKAAIDSTESFINAHKQWAQAPSASKKATALQNLIAKAEARRDMLAELIRTNPAEALRVAIPEEKQAGMPAEVLEMLEQKIEIEGELEAVITDYEDGSFKLSHVLKTPFGENFELHLADKNRNFASGTQVSVNGLLLDGGSDEVGNDGDIAVSANPEDILTLSVDGGTDGGSNGGSIWDTTSTVGEQKVLAIMVNWQDAPSDTIITASELQSRFERTNQFIQENSYGQASVSADITGYYTLPMNSDDSCIVNDIAFYADQAASQAGVDVASYDRIMYIMAPNSACSFTGKGTVGGIPSRSWIKVPDDGILTHELGHNLGLLHANGLACSGGTIAGECSHGEYGDQFDRMGTGAGHFNAYQKERLGWFGSRLKTVTQSGAYDLSAYEFDGPNPLALKILKGIDSVTGYETWYYLEARKPVGEDQFSLAFGNPEKGILVHTGENRLKNTNYLLDMTPETLGNRWDAALEQGYSFNDPDAGVTVTTAWVDANGAQVDINLKGVTATCKRANPTLSLSPGQSEWVPAGTAVSFSVTVTNKDSSACSNSSFSLGKSLPSGWSGSFNSSSQTLAPGASATTTLTVTSANSATDGFYTIGVNASNGGYSASGDVTYVVDNSVGNTAPLAANDSASTEAGTSVNIPVLTNDSDPDGDSLTITSVSGVNGTAVINNGSVTFTPTAGFSGTEVFSYSISDGNGGSASASVSVTVNAVASNSAPVAGNDSATTDAGVAVTIAVLNNDSDPDGDNLTVTSVSGVNGTAVINNDGTITFTPASGFSGNETFSYVVSDGNGGSASANVTVTVNATPVDTNSAPIAVNDSATLPSVTAINITVLANDSDPEGDTLKVMSVTKAAKGTVEINTDGTITYIPGNRFKNADSFSYTITDGKKTATATVNVQLQKSTGGSNGKGNGKKN